MLEAMTTTVPYPLDYQLTLGRMLRERVNAGGSEADRAREALARLQRPDFGTCAGCSRLIAYLELAADPAARFCASCTRRNP
jgi:RNA polymerase-binding transcription factor DksA